MLKSIFVGAFISLAAMTAPAVAASLDGAGSTAIYPVLSKWADDYAKQTGTTVNYQAIGSGGGIKQIEAKTVGFGATDKPLKDAELGSNNLVQFPQVIIGITPVVNIAGIKPGDMVLNGDTLARIYLGEISSWDDPAIKALNPSLNLPHLAISTVHRSDGSGTTFNFASYLSKVSMKWSLSVGADTAINWTGGVGGKGNAGVAGYVKQINGAIGYVEYAYAVQNNLAYTDMINSAGKRVSPKIETFQAAAANADFTKVSNFYLVLTNQPGDQSWPITGTTWVLLRTDTPADQNAEMIKFFDWALKNGQADAKALEYVPLPDNVVQLIGSTWTSKLGYKSM
ncbi:MAG TPA: phosphate ABC transporter substrate-binding protein PstS [Parvibaculum sp.]